MAKLFQRLKEEKEDQEKLRNIKVHKLYNDHKALYENRTAEIGTRANAASYVLTDRDEAKLAEVDALQVELEKLLKDKIDIERQNAIEIQNDPVRIQGEIETVKGIIEYIKNKVGSTGKRRDLTRMDAEAIYDRIKNVYDGILTRKEELKLTEEHFEPLEDEIQKQAIVIIEKINSLLDELTDKMSAVEAQEVEDALSEAEHVLDAQQEYFLRVYEILNNLKDIANLKSNDERELRRFKGGYRKLKTFESREQWRDSVHKLKGRVDKISKRAITPELKARIDKDLRDLKIFEHDWLKQTAIDLKEEIEKTPVDWNKVIEIIDKLLTDTRAADALEKHLKETLERIKEGVKLAESAANAVWNQVRKAGGPAASAREATKNVISTIGRVAGSARRLTKRGPTVGQAAGAVGGALLARIRSLSVPNPIKITLSTLASGGRLTQRGAANLLEFIKGKVPDNIGSAVGTGVRTGTAIPANVLSVIVTNLSKIPHPDLGALLARIKSLSVPNPIKTALSAIASGRQIGQTGLTNLVIKP